LYVNPLVKPQPARTTARGLQGVPSAPLTLPVVDDFAEKNPWPATNIWESRGVFINTNYGINPPTLGVATFDAQGDDGHIYPHIGPSSDTADWLASFPIRLNGEASVVLSFFYQPGGRGDMPEYTDKLHLEFWDNNQWNTVWTASVNETDSTLTETDYLTGDLRVYTGRHDTLFRYVALPLNDARYLIADFRFRFVNIASMAVSPVPGRESNCDHWHLDFVYLNRNRALSDTLLPDVAISEPQPPMTAGYTAIPAKHLRTSEARQQLFGNPMHFSLAYRNLGWGPRNVTRRFSITPLQGSYAYPQEYSGGSENIFNGQFFIRDYDFSPYEFDAIDPVADSVAFRIRSYLINDTDMAPLRAALRHNDTTEYIQAFYTYYSYDDGTAENGYGLTGTGSANGKVAIRFTSFETDSLRAISIYFNKARDSANVKPFRMVVWDDNNGQPGAELYNQRVAEPAFSDERNRFVTYKLPEAIEIKRGQSFYIGWIQQSETYMNVGYDVNMNGQAMTFYNIGNVWQSSIYQGSLMIRPVFGGAASLDDAIPLPQPLPTPAPPATDWTVFPNPAYDVVHIRRHVNGEETIPASCRIDLYDVGKQLMQSTTTTNGSISTGRMPNGMYILRIFENNRLVATRQILKLTP
ncbi:MAG: T9SS type A sorting domain-containing protein, partial [Prevotellaceae bacterium]|nr:T9SS type A sorting domain-containing protein [Prevotellaceae bacterium]